MVRKYIKMENNKVDQDICTSCENPIEVNENTPRDDDDNYFCQSCWDELAPVMRKEAEVARKQTKTRVTKSVSIPEFEESMKGITQEQKDNVDKQLKQMHEEFYEDDEIILPDTCPKCRKRYDEIDYEYQICHRCKYDNNKK